MNDNNSNVPAAEWETDDYITFDQEIKFRQN